MLGTQKYATIPKNADKVLFAEDFVNHIMLKLKLPLVSTGIADHRSRVYNAFNPEVRIAANYTYNCMEDDIEEDFEGILMQNTVDLNAFSEYALDMESRFIYVLSSVTGSRNLMQFCVSVSTMAGKFYMRSQFREVPFLAVDHIINYMDGIDMVEEGGWKELNLVAASWSRCYVDTYKHHLTPDSDYDRQIQSSSPPSSNNSEASRSPDREIDGRVGAEEHPEELTGDKMCIAARSSSSEKLVSSSSDCKQIEKTKDVKAGNNVNSFNNGSSSVLPGSSKETSFHSFEEASSEDDSSKQNIQINTKPSCSYSKQSDNDSKLCETDLKTTDYIESFSRQLTEKRSAILSSPVNKFLRSDSVQHFKTSSSDNLTTEDLNTSLVDEGGRVKSSCAKSSPTQKPLSKRRK